MCDVVEALLIERVMGDVRSDQHAAQMSAMLGGSPEWPTVADRLEQFRQILNAEPVEVDPEDQELREALGLRGNRG